MKRVITLKLTKIFSAESVITMNDIKNDSLEVSTENCTEATEVADADPY